MSAFRVVSIVGGVLAIGIAAGVLLRERAAPQTAAGAPPLASALPAAPAPSAPLPVDAAVASSPLLDPAAVARMRASSAVIAALTGDELELAAIGLGDQGLATVGDAQRAEVGALFARMFGGMSPGERDAFSDVVAGLRAGRPAVPARAKAALDALHAAALRLPPDARERLRALYSAAIQSAISERAAAVERTRTAVAVATVTPAEVRAALQAGRVGHARSEAARAGAPGRASTSDRPSPSALTARTTPEPVSSNAPGPSAPVHDGLYWRRTLEEAQKRVASAEAALKAAEAAPPDEDPPYTGPGIPMKLVKEPARPKTGGFIASGESVIAMRDASRQREAAERERAHQAPPEKREVRIKKCTEALAAARASLAKIEEETRRYGLTVY
jgi:hypothetical protein